MLYSLFLLYHQLDVYQNMLGLRCWSLALTLYSLFKNQKEVLT